MNDPVDWIRAVFTGAFIGGFLWAIMVKMLSVLTHGAISTRHLYTFFPQYRFASSRSELFCTCGRKRHYGVVQQSESSSLR
jgi:hypothetical protein